MMKFHWHYDGFMSGQTTDGRYASHYYFAVVPSLEQIPAGNQMREILERKGFALVGSFPRVHRVEQTEPKAVISYSAFGYLMFTRGEACITCSFRSPYSATAEEALRQTSVAPGPLSFAGQVPMGRGQLRAARRLALDLVRDNKDVLEYIDGVEIACDTRGGRGGRKTKVLHHRFDLDVLMRELGIPVEPRR